MKIRIFDKFDPGFTCGIYEGVDTVLDGDVYFENGDVYENFIDKDFTDWEELKEERSIA